MKGRWGLALKECMEGDVRSLLASMEDPSDFVDGKVVNPAQLGGGFTRMKPLDTTHLEYDKTSGDRRDEVMFAIGGLLKSEVLNKQNKAYLGQEVRRAFYPELRLPYVYRSRHAALDTAKKLQARAEGKRDKTIGTDTVDEEVLQTACTSKDLVPTSHPLKNGPAFVAEDEFGRELETERRADAMQRMKFEIYTNKIQARYLNNHFTPSKKSLGQQRTKSLFKFYYDGDDLQYSPDKPLWMQDLDIRRGGSSVVGQDLEAGKLRNLQRFIRRVSELGSPDTVGDVHRLLAEQRSLQSDFHNESYVLGQRYSAMINRRDQAMRRRSVPLITQYKDAIDAEQPLAHRVTNKRRRKMLLDEAAEEAAADVLLAQQSMKNGREHTKRLAFQDDREARLVNSADPRDFLPETKRSTTYLDKYSFTGTVEDPRVHNPFVLARDAANPLTSELRGRDVAVWEAEDGAGLPGQHRAIAEKISHVFDYQRASDRVLSGLQEKAMCDWRPTKSAQQIAYEESVRGKGQFGRRPAGFWSRANPDLRMTNEWDDILGAPFKKDTNIIDKVEFYRKRIAWEKRKELAIRWGLQPKPNETQLERNERREALDERIGNLANMHQPANGKPNTYGHMMAAWAEPQRVVPYYGKRHFRDRAIFNTEFYPLSQRPLADVLKVQAVEASQRLPQREFTREEADDLRFLRGWFAEDAAVLKMRREDPRMDYLQTAGRVHKGGQQPANNYIQVQECLWELRTYRGEPEPGPMDRTYLEDSSSVNMMNDAWFHREEKALRAEFNAGLQDDHKDAGASKSHETLEFKAEEEQGLIGWKSPEGVDKWRTQDDGCKEGLELHREMTFPIEEVNHINSTRWLAKTPWDRIAAKDLTTKVMNPEDDARPMELGTSYYFNRNRLHYHRLPVQRLRAYGAELRELKYLAEKVIPDEMAHNIKNHYAVARHNTIPYFSNHVSKNGPKFMYTPKVSFDSIGLHDDLEDYVRVNPHLSKWEAM